MFIKKKVNNLFAILFRWQELALKILEPTLFWATWFSAPNCLKVFKSLAVKCGRTLGKGSEAWIFALDAMVNVKENKQVDDAYLKGELDKAGKAFAPVQKVKQDETRLTRLSRMEQ